MLLLEMSFMSPDDSVSGTHCLKWHGTTSYIGRLCRVVPRLDQGPLKVRLDDVPFAEALQDTDLKSLRMRHIIGKYLAQANEYGTVMRPDIDAPMGQIAPYHHQPF